MWFSLVKSETPLPWQNISRHNGSSTCTIWLHEGLDLEKEFFFVSDCPYGSEGEYIIASHLQKSLLAALVIHPFITLIFKFVFLDIFLSSKNYF